MNLGRAGYFTPGIHILVWCLLLGIPTIVFNNQTFFGLTKSFFVITTIYHIGLFYLNAYFLYPRLLTKKRWPLYVLALSALIAFSYHMKIYFLRFDPGFQLTRNNS